MERATLPPASAEAIDAGCPAEAIGLASAFRPPEPRAKRGWVVSGGGLGGLAEAGRLPDPPVRLVHVLHIRPVGMAARTRRGRLKRW